MSEQRGSTTSVLLKETEETTAPVDAEPLAEPRRIHSYDLYRGLLLAAMFVWHILLNLTSLPLHGDYFRWISMGFVMFLGVGLARFLRHKTRKKLSLAAKLFVTFFALNIHNYLKPTFDPLVLITGSQRDLSFEVLFPMGLLILLSIALDYTERHSYLLLGLTYLSIVTLNLAGARIYNLQILLYGLLGYFLASRVDLDGVARESRHLWLTVLAAGACCVPFVLRRFGYYFDFLFAPSILACYFLVTWWVKKNRALEFVGRNSFVIYVGQIILVKALAVTVFSGA